MQTRPDRVGNPAKDNQTGIDNSKSNTGMPATIFPVPPLAARIFAIARANGGDARIVGGAVRDWLAGENIGDIDMAIALPINEAVAAFIADGLRVIETGIAHGTVTVLPGKQSAGLPANSDAIEVTQTRVDVETDGRHAVVAYSDDWAADAARRDFTINAIYLDDDGKIDDPLDGRSDLAAGQLVFAGSAEERCREDALRMLRYCRFLPLFGRAGADADAVAALRSCAGLAAGLSGERVQHEMRRICSGFGAAIAFTVMQDCDVAVSAIGVDLMPDKIALLPDYSDFPEIPDEDGLWLLFLAVMLPDDTAGYVSKRLRLSRKQARLLEGLMSYIKSAELAGDELAGDRWRQAAWRLRRAGMDPGFCYAASLAAGNRRPDSDRIALLSNWQAPSCPVSGADLLSQGVDKGPGLGQLLATIETRWAKSDFTLSKAELLAGVEG